MKRFLRFSGGHCRPFLDRCTMAINGMDPTAFRSGKLYPQEALALELAAGTRVQRERERERVRV